MARRAGQIAAVAQAVGIPVAVKIGAHLSAPANFATKVAAAGAAGLVLTCRLETTVPRPAGRSPRNW